LERAFRGEIDRLMLIIPPRFGKSELASRRFPAWALAQNPRLQFISASAGADLAHDFGREVRNIVTSEDYQSIFATRLAQDAKAANKWVTSEGGSYYAVGVGSNVFGRGADILLIDDPFGTMEDADSELARERVWKWYQGSLYNRLQPGACIVVIGHRMHEDDLQGRLLAQQSQGGDKWEVVNLPAIAEAADPLGREPGEALWPERFPVEALARIEANSIPRYYSALYCGRGSPAQGDMFKPDKLVKRDDRGECAIWVRAWDLAASKAGDYTVGVLMGRTGDGRYVIADVRRIRGTPDEVEALIAETATTDGVGVRISLPKDPGQASLFQVQYLTTKLAGFIVSNSPEAGNKEVRAEPLASQVNVGNVSIVRGDWNYGYTDELRAFPVGAHDDQVDASSRAFQFLCEETGLFVVSDGLLQAVSMRSRRGAKRFGR
jgi:predicted phage terminase large subunit-like protein